MIKLSKSIYNYKQQSDYPQSKSFYNELKLNERISKQQLADLQLKKLNELLSFCYKNAPFYRHLWDSYELKPKLSYLDDFDKFPLVSKEMLTEALEKNIIIPEFLNKKDLYYTETTGSTGQPFKYPLDKLSSSKRHAVVLRSNDWYNYKMGDTRMIKFWRGTLNRIWKDDVREYIYKNRILTIYDPNNPISTQLSEEKAIYFIKELNEFKPEIIDGFVSAITFLAKYMIDTDTKLNFELKSVVTGAEYLSNQARVMIEQAFNVPVFNRYGGTESGLIAHETFEETQSNHYLHIASDAIYTELYKDNQPILDGEGEIIFTDFSCLSMPFVKYKNGDMGVFSKSAQSKSQLPFPFFTEVKGRINDYFLLPNGNLLSSHIWHNYFRQATFIKEFQIIQEEIDLVKILFVFDEKYKIDSNFDDLKQKVLQALPCCTVYWEQLTKIPVGKGGKFRHSVSKVKIELNSIR